MSKVAVVTGSNKGIGFAIVKALCQNFDGVVFLTSRDEKRGLEAMEILTKLGFKPEYHQLDVTDRKSLEKFKHAVLARYSGIDILINNAAIVDTDFYNCTYDDSKNVIEVNFNGLLNVQDILFPIIKYGGRIINISSNCGHLSNLQNDYRIKRFLKKDDLVIEDVKDFVQWFLDSLKNGTFKKEDFIDPTVVAYRVSKIAMSAVTPIQQKLLRSRDISINSMHPGVVRTGMTNYAGFFTADEAAKTVLYLALEAPQSLKGEYIWYDKRIVDWFDYSSDHAFRLDKLNEYKF